MSLFNYVGENIPYQLTTSREALEIRLPTPTDSDLRDMYQQRQMMRWGIVAAIMRKPADGSNPQILLMQHNGSDKTPHGAWGSLGETSRIRTDPITGARQVEPTTTTLLRGISEEIGLHLAAGDLQASTSRSYLDTTWPVGKNYPGQLGGARCPLVFVSGSLAERFEQAGPSPETMANRKFFDIDDALDMAEHANDTRSTELVRYGLATWLQVTRSAVEAIQTDELAPLTTEPWLHSTDETHDALLNKLYDK